MFALNQGEVCTCPSRALVQTSTYERFMERAVVRVEAIVRGNPLAPDSMMGAQVSREELEKIAGYLDLGREEGASVLTGGAAGDLNGGLKNGFYLMRMTFAVSAGRRRRNSGGARWCCSNRARSARPSTAWLKRYRAEREDGVLDGRRVSPRRGKGILTGEAAGQVRRWIADKMPDQLKLPFALWTARAVLELTS